MSTASGPNETNHDNSSEWLSGILYAGSEWSPLLGFLAKHEDFACQSPNISIAMVTI